MFSADFYIDSVQTAKKNFVNTFVTNEAVKTALNSFVDAQSTYTKEAVKTFTKATTTVASEAVKTFTDATKVDYTKFFKGAK
jgi:hypothetical protein